MAPHSSTLAWKIPWTEEPGRLQSMGSLKVGHNWATPLSLFTFMHWRRKWQPTPVFLPGEPQGQRSLVGCRLSGRTESDTTEATSQTSTYLFFCFIKVFCFYFWWIVNFKARWIFSFMAVYFDSRHLYVCIFVIKPYTAKLIFQTAEHKVQSW